MLGVEFGLVAFVLLDVPTVHQASPDLIVEFRLQRTRTIVAVDAHIACRQGLEEALSFVVEALAVQHLAEVHDLVPPLPHAHRREQPTELSLCGLYVAVLGNRLAGLPQVPARRARGHALAERLLVGRHVPAQHHVSIGHNIQCIPALVYLFVVEGGVEDGDEALVDLPILRVIVGQWTIDVEAAPPFQQHQEANEGTSEVLSQILFG